MTKKHNNRILGLGYYHSEIKCVNIWETDPDLW
jgi:hypothetical protein